eukprot:28576-Prorocentrum_minimum.AAC.2
MCTPPRGARRKNFGNNLAPTAKTSEPELCSLLEPRWCSRLEPRRCSRSKPGRCQSMRHGSRAWTWSPVKAWT